MDAIFSIESCNSNSYCHEYHIPANVARIFMCRELVANHFWRNFEF